MVCNVKKIVSGPKQTQIIIDMGDSITPSEHRFTVKEFILVWDTSKDILERDDPNDIDPVWHNCHVVPFERAIQCPDDNMCYILLENIIHTISAAINSDFRVYLPGSHWLDEVEFADACWDILQRRYPARKEVFRLRRITAQ